MREIKFRGKRVDNGKWINGAYYEHFPPLQAITPNNYVSEESKHYIARTAFADWNMSRQVEFHEVDKKTVGQYTGMNDKHGKEIFEGHIVKKHVHNNYKNGNKIPIYRNYVIEFENLSFKFKALEKEPYILEFGSGELEVIGNIYENPELLGGVYNG